MHIAERMLKGFLTRIQYNHPGVRMKVESVNVVEDAELKYDLKITVIRHRRGIAIEGENLPREEYAALKKSVGIQLSTRQGSGTGGKGGQIKEVKNLIGQHPEYLGFLKKPVDDIVLVKVPFETYQINFRRWLDEGKPSGGPEQYLTREEKIKILKAVTKDILDLSNEELEKIIA